MITAVILCALFSLAAIRTSDATCQDALPDPAIYCGVNETLETRTPLCNLTDFDRFTIANCPLPTVSYAEALDNLKINSAKITHLSTKNVMPLTAKHLTGLTSVRILICISALKDGQIIKLDKMLAPEDNFIEPLKNLVSMSVTNVVVPRMPENTALLEFSMTSSIVNRPWGGCKVLGFIESKKTQVSEKTNLLSNCTKLQRMFLVNMTEESVRNILSGVKSLTSISIVNSGITKVPRTLFDNINLEKLNLRGNKLTEIGMYYVHRVALKSLTQLEELDVSDNPLADEEELIETIVSLRALKTLRVFNLPFVEHCGKPLIRAGWNTRYDSEEKFKVGQTVEYLCEVLVDEPKPQCIPLNVVQVHQLMGQQIPSYSSWRTAGTNSVILNMTLTRKDNGSRLLCRGVFNDQYIMSEEVILHVT